MKALLKIVPLTSPPKKGQRVAYENVYERQVEGLEQSQGDWWKFIPYNQLSTNQKIIFDSLKVHQQ